jgi:hypothetical protein
VRVLAVAAALICGAVVRADTVRVRHLEGGIHGFLALRTLDGTIIADGDLIQSADSARVTSRLAFKFRDGSVYDETAVFSQKGTFRLLNDHLVQKGPSFPQSIDMTIAASGDVTVRYTDNGEQKTEHEHLALPPDISNGLILTLLKNVRPDAPPESFSFVAPTPKPRLVKLKIAVQGNDRFSTGGAASTAAHYVLKADIGGLVGLVAPLVGKQPPDSHVWILGGEAPAFVKSEQPLYYGGPVWRIELVGPTWPKS